LGELVELLLSYKGQLIKIGGYNLDTQTIAGMPYISMD
jgi:hypothetical protein